MPRGQRIKRNTSREYHCGKPLLKIVRNIFKNLLTNRTKCAIIIMLRETKTRDTKMGAHK